MKDVLLGIDQSVERAVAQVNTVLELFDVDNIHVYLLHDFVENPEGASVVQVDSVKRAQELLEDADIPVDLREGSGDPAESIIETSEAIDADAICIAGRKRSPAGKMLFGSVSQSVILNTQRPVLLCSPSDDEE
ncbi:universal stress protein [Salinibaculum rarum]|uniref:universal stress protein n=1 Tax=Salinibaculum rarum TaxID=3058903 RepID=UPI00265DF9CD|nr:universal stress protein [Salinibaculum sp. KK48]